MREGACGSIVGKNVESWEDKVENSFLPFYGVKDKTKTVFLSSINMHTVSSF